MKSISSLDLTVVPRIARPRCSAASSAGALVLLLSYSGCALAADYWLPVAESACKVWSDEPLADGEVIRWSGGCEAGKLSGKGSLEVAKGARRTLRFEGTLRAGKAEGVGRVEHARDAGTERYEGMFKHSLFDGYGVLELADGSRYEGGFKEDRPHGYGLYKGADGESYQGEIKDGGFPTARDSARARMGRNTRANSPRASGRVRASFSSRTVMSTRGSSEAASPADPASSRPGTATSTWARGVTARPKAPSSSPRPTAPRSGRSGRTTSLCGSGPLCGDR